LAKNWVDAVTYVEQVLSIAGALAPFIVSPSSTQLMTALGRVTLNDDWYYCVTRAAELRAEDSMACIAVLISAGLDAV